MSTQSQRNIVADLLEQVLGGTVSPEEALKIAESQNEIPWKEREINNAWHTLMHFHIDEDIRSKDPEYDEGMKEGLRKHIAILRRE